MVVFLITVGMLIIEYEYIDNTKDAAPNMAAAGLQDLYLYAIEILNGELVHFDPYFFPNRIYVVVA